MTLCTISKGSIHDAESLFRVTLNNYLMCTTFNFYVEDIGFWVKPCSTTWFPKFLLEQYDNSRWVSMFRMTKPCVFAFTELLRPELAQKNTTYTIAILVLTRVACLLFKLVTYSANLSICNEVFAIGHNTVCMVLCEVVNAINDTLRYKIQWPTEDKLRNTQEKFSKLCGLLGIVGAIDGMHVATAKP